MTMALHDASVWNYGRFFEGFAPIRIALPVWRMPSPLASRKPKLPCVSQDEILQLFQTELRPMPRAPRIAPSYTPNEDLQRQGMQRLRAALYAV
jgi:hypothetical protein